MSSQIQKSIFRVISPDGQWVGSGFLILVEGVQSQPVFLTCAHVIGDALGDRALAENELPPKRSFFVDFPNSGLTSKFEARVYQNDPKAWHPMRAALNEVDPLQDLAFVNIDMVSPPDGVEPAVITETPLEVIGQKVLAYGGAEANTNYADNFPKLSEGKVQGRVGALLQIRASDPDDRAFIERGYSGGPIWSPDAGAVLGVVAIADENENLAWAIPSSVLYSILKPKTSKPEMDEHGKNADDLPEIPFDYQPRPRELLLKRKNLEDYVDQKVDEGFLLYLHGDANTGKSSEIQRLMESPVAKVTKRRTIWQTCIKGMGFAEMADHIAEDCLKIEDGKRFGARELIRALRDRQMFLVLDGYSKQDHPTITPLIEYAAPLDKPTHLVVTTVDDPDSTDMEQCAVLVPKVHREEVIASIEALGTELTLEYAQLVEGESYDASSAYHIVSQVKRGTLVPRNNEDPRDRVTRLFHDVWPEEVRSLMSCLALVETSVLEELFVSLSKKFGVQGLTDLRATLLSESLIRTDDPKSFTLRDYCRQAILTCMDESRSDEYHQCLGDSFYELLSEKSFNGYNTPSGDILDAVRSVRHYQLSRGKLERRLQLLSDIKSSAARKGMHRQLATIIGCEVEERSKIDPWLHIQLIQSQLALGRIKNAFYVAKIAQREIFGLPQVDTNLVVSLCTQFASILSQARENTLAGHMLGVSKNLFPNHRVSPGLITIRDSLKAWCDGKAGKTDLARKVGRRLLTAARHEKGQKRFMQVGIESTRLGVLEGAVGNLRAADQLLSTAVENFSRCDRRGEIWALSHQCYYRIASASTELPVEQLERLVDLQSTTLLISEETFSHYQAFELALRGHDLHSRVRDLSEKFAPRYQDMKLSDYEIEYAEAFIETLRKEFGRKQPKASRQSFKFLLSEQSIDSPVDSDVSLVTELIKDDPKQVLVSLYQGVSKSELLNSLFYSRVLTASLLKVNDEELIDAFIETYFEDLIASKRLTRLNFAGFFERCGRPTLGLELLASLRGEDSFRYHNIAANCHKKSNFEKARYHNERALIKAASPEEKARIHNNLAALYLLHGYHERISVINENIDVAKKLRASHFYWPFRTELAARLSIAAEDDFESIIVEYSMTQRLSERAIKYVANLLIEPARRMRFLDIAPRYLSR